MISPKSSMLRQPRLAAEAERFMVGFNVGVVDSAASDFSEAVHSNLSGADQCLTRDHGAVITLMHMLDESGIGSSGKNRQG